ncbi:ECF-type sigma factor [Tundrisphaera sp. TA3]|uniref:ECF-type sigma factor n=1 Tax=Tundrisphaera sp. TA3 TaxID=3435775 RepID=UPI003EBA7ED8
MTQEMGSPNGVASADRTSVAAIGGDATAAVPGAGESPGRRDVPKAAGDLLPLVYEELRKLASARLAVEPPGRTLQPTALVHEAYLRLIGPADGRRWEDRGHFFAAAAEAMRRILIEAARRKGRLRHGGDRRRVELDDVPDAIPDDDLLALDEALARLEERDAGKAALVKLRYFAGLTTAQAAAALDISVATAERRWAFSRAWLHAEINGPAGADPRPA